jgi:hypothetical protein
VSRPRKISGVYRVLTDALDISRRVSCDGHDDPNPSECFGCQIAAQWRRDYEAAGYNVERFINDPFNEGWGVE